MSIKLGSRYELSVVDYLSLDILGDSYPVVFYEFEDLGTLTYQEYPWKEGDRLDNIAVKFYRNPRLWWVIAEANPEIEDIQYIPAGTVLRIPSV